MTILPDLDLKGSSLSCVGWMASLTPCSIASVSDEEDDDLPLLLEPPELVPPEPGKVFLNPPSVRGDIGISIPYLYNL
jgi:hypothetical protein